MGSHKFHGKDKDFYLATPVTNTLHVDNKRTDTYVENGSITKPFKTIQAAIDAIVAPSATNKHLIEISPGSNYSDPITINKIYTTFRSCGVQGARISGLVTVNTPSLSQITFVGLRISGGLSCTVSHICINAIDCNITGSDWNINPAVPTDDEYLQVWGGLFYANCNLTNVYAYLMGGGYYSIFVAENKEFNINNADINTPFQVTLNGTVIASAYGNRAGSSNFILNAGATLNIDADTEGGSSVTVNPGATLNRTTKASNVNNDSSVTGVTVKNALETLGALSHTQNTDKYLTTQITHKLYVDGNRTDVYVEDGSFTKPFKKIQDAIDAASGAAAYNRITIQIMPGQYLEQIVMKTWVHLVALVPDSVWIQSAAGDVVTSSVDSNLTNIAITYTGTDNTKVGLRCNNGAILVAREVIVYASYTGVVLESGAIFIEYGGGTLTGEADSFIVKNGAYAAFYSTTLAGWGAPYYDLTIEAGGYVDVMDVQLYNERLNNLGTLNLVTPASRIKNDSTVVGNSVKDALDTLDNLTKVVTHDVYVDKYRVDTYTETGAINRPFKKIQDAIDYVASVAVAGQDWSIQIMTGQYVENIVLEDPNLYMISLIGVGGIVGIVPVSGNAIQSISNNANLSKLRMSNIEVTRPLVITGPNGGTCFSDVWAQDCKFVLNGTITLNCINNFSLMSTYIETAISLTNVNWFYADSGRLNDAITMVCDSALPAPSSGFNCTTFLNGLYQMGNITLTKGGTATGIFVTIGSRVNGSSGTIVNPVGWTFQAYNSFIRGNFTNNGTFQQRTSFVEKVFTNTGTWTLDDKCSQIKNDSTVIGDTVKNALETLDSTKYTEDNEIKIKVYSQAAEPALSADQKLAIWIDTDDSNRVYLVFRRGVGDQVSVELGP